MPFVPLSFFWRNSSNLSNTLAFLDNLLDSVGNIDNSAISALGFAWIPFRVKYSAKETVYFAIPEAVESFFRWVNA